MFPASPESCCIVNLIVNSGYKSVPRSMNISAFVRWIGTERKLD